MGTFGSSTSADTENGFIGFFSWQNGAKAERAGGLAVDFGDPEKQGYVQYAHGFILSIQAMASHHTNFFNKDVLVIKQASKSLIQKNGVQIFEFVTYLESYPGQGGGG